MKLNFRHAAFGAALAFAASSAIAAIVAPAVPAQYSKEGVELAGSTLTLGTINVTLEQNYSFNDIIVVSLTGAELVTGTNQTAVLNCPGTPTTPLPATEANTLKYRIADPAGATTGEICTLSTVALTSTSVATGEGKFGVCWKGYFGSTTDVIDSGCTAETALTAKAQTAAKVTQKLDGVIDVSTKNTKFEGGVTSDVLVLSLTASSAGFTIPTVDVTKQTITINGDFSYADGNDAGTTCDATELAGTLGISNVNYTVQTGSTCTKLVIAATNAATVTADNTLTITFNIPGTKAVSPQVFLGDVKFDYKETAGTDTSSRTYALDFGSWTLNGAQVYINYMPYNGVSGNISRIVYVSNRGSLTGNIDVRVFQESGGTSCDFSGGSIGPGQIKQLSSLMDSAVYLCWGNTFTGKVHAIVSVSAPKNSIEVYSAYNVGGSDRGTVVNTSNGRIVTSGNSQ